MSRTWLFGPGADGKSSDEMKADRDREAAQAREERIQEKVATLRAATDRETARIAAEKKAQKR